MRKYVITIFLILIMFLSKVILHIIEPRENDYKNILAKTVYKDTLLTHYLNSYLPIYSDKYLKYDRIAIFKQLDITINIDSNIKLSDNSVFLLTDNFRLIFYDGVELSKTDVNTNVYNYKSGYYFNENFGKSSILYLFCIDTLNKNMYRWSTDELHCIYDAKKIAIKCDQYSTCVVKLDNDWFYK